MNTDKPLSIKSLKGKVIAIHAFLGPVDTHCVSHGIPQALKMNRLFEHESVVTLGLHTVFEHHDVMAADALNVFLHEYRILFPVAIDAPSKTSPIPCSMGNYGLLGTPSLVIIDKNGVIRLNHFGRLDDMFVGKVLGQLISESSNQIEERTITADEPAALEGKSEVCDERGCRL